MWRINALDVIALGRTPGGAVFTELVDALIRGQAHLGGVDASKIRTNLRVNVKDGGVDTQVLVGCPGDTTGWLREHATVFQYKAKAARDVTEGDLTEDIHKPYSQKCIRDGHAYRLCVCDAISPEKKNSWEELLTREARRISPGAPPSMVLSADDVAAWASQLTGVVWKYFRPNLAEICMHLETWGTSITESTPTFVPVAAHEPIRQRITEHVDYTGSPVEPVLPISGEAGVGKTRLVYEVLASLGQLNGLVVYARDEQDAMKVATLLANDTLQKAILVADECGVKTRLDLNRTLAGAKSRVRVINIDNSGERPPSGAPEHWMQKIPEDSVEAILKENFPDVPAQRRHAYASLSGGFVRLAADLCRHDDLAAASRGISEYIESRLTKEEHEVLLGLSLVTKVGMKSDVAGELKDLANLTGVEVSKLTEAANRLHDGPGFISKAGRFYYVTPEIVAQVAFDRAWDRWAKHDPESFLRRIPRSLLQVFMKRAATSVRKEVRRVVGDFFRKWSHTLTPTQLRSLDAVDWLVILIEVEPETYLPTLRRLVEEATEDELLAVTGESTGGRWGPRRALVWLAQRMAAFPEHFDDVERILLRLAVVESEPTIGNNATAQWSQLFWIALSGTALPFPERILRLEQRIFSGEGGASTVALVALGQLLARQHWRMAGPAVVAGKVPPDEWTPKTNRELKAYRDSVVALIQKLIVDNSVDREFKERVQHTVLKDARFLLSSGYLEAMRSIFPEDILADEVRARLIEQVQDFLHYDAQEETRDWASRERYVADVKGWLALLQPSGFHGKLVSLVAIEPWHHRLLENEEAWKSQIHSLAHKCLANQSLFEEEIQWLCSPVAKSASYLGYELGKIDANAELLERLVDSALRYDSAELARSYIAGLVGSYPSQAKRVNESIDRAEQASPELGYQLFMGGGDAANSLPRALHLVDTGKLPVKYLRGFTFGSGDREILSEHEIVEVLKRLIAATESGDVDARSVAIQLTSFQLERGAEMKREYPLANPKLRALLWHLVELTSLNVVGQSYAWRKIIERLKDYDAPRAMRMIALGLVGDDWNHRKTCEDLFIKFARDEPQAVMNSLGEVMLDDTRGWKFHVAVYRPLFQALPPDVVIAWLNEQGIKGARALARHLPIPFLDAEDNPIVPHLTHFVLETFEDDDTVFHEFVAGTGSFRSYSGDIAAQHEKEAELAARFLNHPLRRIREWAESELKEARWEADRWRQIDEERFLE